MPCVNHQKRITYRDSNGCNNNATKPIDDTRVCIMNSNCTDNDGDGYGVGSDCLGIDLDDNNPRIKDFTTNKKIFRAGDYKSLIYIGSLVLLVIIIVVVLVTIIVRRREEVVIHKHHQHHKQVFNHFGNIERADEYW